MAETTLDALAAAISRRHGLYVSGTATGGSTTTLIDASNLIQPDHALVNLYVRFGSGANAGLERLVTDFTGGTLTFAALPVAVAAGVTYEVGPVQRADIVRAVQDGIDRAGEQWMQVVDTSAGLTFVPSQQEYSLPADCVTVLEVFITRQLLGAQVTEWEPIQEWVVTGAPGARKLTMRGWVTAPVLTSLAYGRRIRYLAMPKLLSASSDTLGLGETAERRAVAYLTEYALYVLGQMMFKRNITGEAARGHLTASNAAYQTAMQIMAEREPKRERRMMTTVPLGRQV